MALQEIMSLSCMRGHKKQGISEERIKKLIPIFRQYISFWREYPDIFVDFLCGGDKAEADTLHLFFYQRVFLRAVMRHRYTYATFPRA